LTGEGFLDHLEELRRRILLSAAAVIVLSAAAFIFRENILSLIRRPYGRELVFIAPHEAFLVSLKLSLLSGVILSSPLIIQQGISFIYSAMTPSEKGLLWRYFPPALLMFAAGILFAFFIVLPYALKFLTGIASSGLKPMISLNSYVSFVSWTLLVFGTVFLLPLLMRLLSVTGVAGKKEYKRYRRHAIVIIFTAAAVLTPPDVLTQLLLSLPLIILYECGILLS
jgi:sec-independent protein translocase protein TatC